MKKDQHTHNATTGSSELHHGDLRKGTYLKRRAAYQMQTGSSPSVQAGTLTAKAKDRA